MREHKYRAFYEKDQKMYQVLTLDIIDKKALIEWRGRTENEYLRGYVPLGDVVLIQYTGLKDKNGREIYEGDIVKCKDECNCLEFTAAVLFGNPNGTYSWGYQLQHLKGDKTNLDILLWVEMEDVGATCEIVGNVYGYPELL